MLNKATMLTVLIFISSIMQSAWAEEGRQKLNDFFTTMNTMQSGFTQEVFDERGQLKQKSSGMVFVQRPGRFRWQYSAPNTHLIVADGKNVWEHDIELEQVTVKPSQQALSAAPIGMLMNKQPVEKQFKVTEMQMQDNNLEWFKLTPHKRDSGFSSMNLGVNKTGIQEMVLEDNLGQQTYIRFQGMKLNIPIDVNRFQFQLPANADLIGKPS